MIIIDFRKLVFFFTLVSLLYVCTPLISTAFFDSNPINLLEFTFIGFFLILIICIFFIKENFYSIYLKDLKPLVTLIFSLIVITTITITLISVYGSFEAAFLQSYTTRTGILLPSYFNALLISAPAITNILLLHLYLNNNLNFMYKLVFGLISICFLFLFLASGNRNLILFSLSIPLGIYISRTKYLNILILFFSMVTVSVIIAAFRNYGLSNFDKFEIPPYNYWNPMIHEFGTSYNVYNMIISNDIVIDGFDFPMMTYIQGLINLLPGVLKPEGYESFSTAISSQLGENGEGFGNSPVAEVIYNSFFPAILFQCIPFLVILFTFKVKTKFSDYFKLISSGLFILSTFNFWRIGFAELLKIQLSFFIVSFICFYILHKKEKINE